MRVKKDYDLTEITRLLLKMRDNCERKEGELYDDPERAEKRNALNAAIDIINKPSYVAAGGLISREAAAQMLMEKSYGYVVSMFPTSDECRTARETARACAKAVREMEGVDAEPVRHGKWIENYAYGAWHYDCPFCDDGYAAKEREKKPVNYCSNCGAKMDGGSENDKP